MRNRLSWRRAVGSMVFILGLGACNLGNGCGCVSALPDGIEVPADQTLEGGAQLRVTPAGFSKLSGLFPALLEDALGSGTCIPKGSLGVKYCDTKDGACNPGCQIDFTNITTDVQVPDDGTLRINAMFDVGTDIHVDYFLGTCTLHAKANNTRLDVDVGVGIDPATGELDIHLQSFNNVNISPSISGCGGVGSVLDALLGGLGSIINGILNSFIGDVIAPLLDGLIDSLLPDPLGLEGMLDASAVVPGVSQETAGSLEMRMVPGGYAFLERNGMSLGVITGVNSDEDLSTRTADLDSEPSLCVPPMQAPDFAAPPASLPTSVRGNFNLPAAGAFRGQPDPSGTDMVIGASETMLDLLGHHLVTSGGMCIGVGSELSSQLNVGTLGLLVPSLAELGSEDGSDPLLLVTRPQHGIDFSIGAGTEADPSLTIHLKDFKIDFYAFLFERYVRAFTLSLTVDAGVNMEFTLDADGKPAIVPTIVGLDSSSIGIEASNTELLREGPDTLEDVLPSILNALLPQLTSGIGPITLPDFAGFTLTNLSVEKVTTSEDDFLAIAAELGASTLLRQIGERHPALARFGESLPEAPVPAPVRASAKLLSVDTPPPDVIRDALHGVPGATLPSVTIDTPAFDAAGRPLEWSYNLDGGIWHPFRAASPLVITDRAFAWQGRYTIELYSRVAGDYTTTSLEPIRIPVVIDSAPPRIHTASAALDGDAIAVPVSDLVSPAESIQVAFTSPGAPAPESGWGKPRLPTSQADNLAKDNIVMVWARDEIGNVGSEPLDLDVLQFHGQGDSQGCNCDAGASSAGSIAGTLLTLGLALLLVGPRRRRSGLLVILAGGVISGATGCSCGDAEDLVCEAGQVRVCFDESMSMCTCTDDVALGRIGEYSELAVAPDNSFWVSAYNSTHGDLMVANVAEVGRIPDAAWEFVDGVPDGPVNVPGSDIRGGVRDPGPDVGLYTDIAVSPSGTVLVSYFDRDNRALKVATLSGGAWATHTVDEGFLGDSETGFEIAGQYSAIAIGPDERPIVAYFVNLEDSTGQRTEVRIARASAAVPASADDWDVSLVQATDVVDSGQADPLNIPEGNGLFINLALDSAGEPVLAYYDRQDGDLELARSDGAGGFTVTTLDGADADVGWYPGLAIDSQDEVHVSYVDATTDDLRYINTLDATPELVDDGYRIVGENSDGLPEPEFHLVGDDSAVVLTSIGPLIVYQDATTHELLMASKDGSGNWQHVTLAGDEDPFAGGYGFYASATTLGGDVVMSSWVIDQPNNDSWVEILAHHVAEQ